MFEGLIRPPKGPYRRFKVFWKVLGVIGDGPGNAFVDKHF